MIFQEHHRRWKNVLYNPLKKVNLQEKLLKYFWGSWSSVEFRWVEDLGEKYTLERKKESKSE